jgi:hypothetical protein
MSNQNYCLLDKVIARYILSGLWKLNQNQPVTQEELFSLNLFYRASSPLHLLIVPATDNVLQQLNKLSQYTSLIEFFRQRTEIIQQARYCKRWSRRLRGYGFSREDANVLTLATFGLDEERVVLGTHFVATYDQPMMNNWTKRGNEIADHLAAMRRDLPEPYDQVSLPLVKRPEAILALV